MVCPQSLPMLQVMTFLFIVFVFRATLSDFNLCTSSEYILVLTMCIEFTFWFFFQALQATDVFFQRQSRMSSVSLTLRVYNFYYHFHIRERLFSFIPTNFSIQMQTHPLSIHGIFSSGVGIMPVSQNHRITDQFKLVQKEIKLFLLQSWMSLLLHTYLRWEAPIWDRNQRL